MERKILGLIQLRFGPDKVSFIGILQPIADAVKLFSKNTFYSILSNKIVFFFRSFYFFFLSLFMFILKPIFGTILIFSFCVLILIIFYSISIYPTLFSGWSSNSKYSLIGSIRNISLTISYEIVIGFLIFSLCMLISNLRFFHFVKMNKKIFLVFYLFMLIIFFFSLIIERNRTPYDLAECESELVSGFNTEYGGLEFSMIFLGENLILIFNSIIVMIFFFNFQLWRIVFLTLLLIFIWLRGAFPRFRLDSVMHICWFFFLPFSINIFIFILTLF